MFDAVLAGLLVVAIIATLVRAYKAGRPAVKLSKEVVLAEIAGIDSRLKAGISVSEAFQLVKQRKRLEGAKRALDLSS